MFEADSTRQMHLVAYRWADRALSLCAKLLLCCYCADVSAACSSEDECTSLQCTASAGLCSGRDGKLVLVPATVLALPWLRCFGVGTQATHRCCIPSGRRWAGTLREASWVRACEAAAVRGKEMRFEMRASVPKAQIAKRYR